MKKGVLNDLGNSLLKILSSKVILSIEKAVVDIKMIMGCKSVGTYDFFLQKCPPGLKLLKKKTLQVYVFRHKS